MIQTGLRHQTQTEHRKFIPDVTHKICSVYPRQMTIENAHGAYIIPAKPDGQEYGFVEVRPGYEKRDFGEGRFASFMTIAAKDVAEDFIGIPQGETQFTDRGVFVPAGEVPTPEEIAAARARLMAWAESQIQHADVSWAQRGSIKDIADDAKIAARMMKLEREWADSWKAKEVGVCPACGQAINKGARIHAVGQGGCGERIEWSADGVASWPNGESPKAATDVRVVSGTKFAPPSSR